MRKDAGLTGKRFCRVTVIKELGIKKGFIRYLYRCDCGTEKEASGHHFLDGHIKSCGCLSSDLTTARNTSHGKSKETEYRIWFNMKARCLNPKHIAYKNYGGRGIRICKRWLKFSGFYADMGKRPTLQHTLDRINNNGNYYPLNCRWATRQQQSNNRRDNVFLTYNRRTLTVGEWAKTANIRTALLYNRIFSLHWTMEDALTKPVQKRASFKYIN